MFYSGLQNVQLNNTNKIDWFYLPTCVSCSYNKQVCKEFADHNGVLLQFDLNIIDKNKFKSLAFCSLEWISPFPDEYEIFTMGSNTHQIRYVLSLISKPDLLLYER